MGRGAAARRGAGGGEVVQAPRQGRARLIAGALAVAIFAAVTAWAAARAGGSGAWVAVPGLLAVGLLAAGTYASWTPAVPLAVALVGGGWAGALLLGGEGVDGAAPLVAAGLFVAAELAYWATAARAVAVDLALLQRQALTVAGIAAASVCLGALLLLVGGASVRGGLPLEALGVAAAIGALAVVARLARGASG